MATPTDSNAVLFHLAMHLKEDLEASERLRHQQQELIDRLKTALDTAVSDGTAIHDRLVSTINGTNIITAGLDALYVLLGRLAATTPAVRDERDRIQRIMLRADVGFAIVQGAPFVDLTANEDMTTEEEGSETESE